MKMATPAIQVRGLSKSYVLHHQAATGNRSLREDIMAGVRGLLSGGRNAAAASKASDEVFWALRDLSFDVERGERIAIIGRNGAGKSTLLKLLSRITKPTDGSIQITGRLSSLLEVGTGFHPELTGRENIFLNGAILGMTNVEVRRKFDDIVEFAEIERFLDTPVKRYSSGMYVRLAFAVSAFLEPDITILDEVLSVGDAAFQRKCQKKMLDLAKQGRTIIFVSHSMSAVKAMCNSGIVLAGGRGSGKLSVDDAIARYLANSKTTDAIEFPLESGDVKVLDIGLSQHGGRADNFDGDDDIEIEIAFQVARRLEDFRIGFYIKTLLGDTLLRSLAADWNQEYAVVEPGLHVLKGGIPRHFLSAGNFVFEFHCSQFGIRDYFADRVAFPIMVRSSPKYNRQHPGEETVGHVHLDPSWVLHHTG
jgi:lipopolysaccharide transport system ATP-binding protein